MRGWLRRRVILLECFRSWFAKIFGQGLRRDFAEDLPGSRQVFRILHVHARLKQEPTCRRIDAPHPGWQGALPAGADQRKLAAVIARGHAASVGEGVGVSVQDFDHVVAAMGIGHFQDDRFRAQIHESEAIDRVDIWRHIARFLGQLGRGNVRHPPDFARRSLGLRTHSIVVAQGIERCGCDTPNGGLQGQ